MTARTDEDIIARARAVPIEDEVARRGVSLKRVARNELAGACPACGGTDRFSINTRKAVWNCRGCEHGGDVIALVMHVDKVGFLEACRILAGEPEDEQKPRPRPIAKPVTKPAPDNSPLALALWQQAVPVVLTPADRYLLQTRKLEVPIDLLTDGEVLRFHPSCPFGEKRYPCLLALWRTIAGDEPAAIMRTALTPDAKKIGRLALGPTGGAAIKLTPDVDVSYGLHIAEGLETGLAAMMQGFAPMWITGLHGIQTFPVLAGIDCLTVIVDNDPPKDGKRAGPDAAAQCVERWTDAGREAQIVAPNKPGSDMADIVKGPSNV